MVEGQWATVRSIIITFRDICLLRVGPQALPASAQLFSVMVALNIGLDLFVAGQRVSADRALWGVLGITAAMLGGVYLLLVLLRYAERALQTLTALSGVGLVVGLIALPLMQAPPESGIAAVVVLVLDVWMLLVIAHILRHAFSVHLFMGGILAVGYFLLNIALVNALLFGAP